MNHLSSKGIALAGVFSALHVILYVSSFDLWRNWSIYLEPIEGIVLGPWVGFSVALLGSIVARMIKPIDLWMFGVIAEPLGALACGLLVKKQWKPLFTIYVVMLAAYFIHPLGRWFPLWTILDIPIALILIYPATKIFESPYEENVKRLTFSLALISFIGTVTDALTRVFLLIPAGLYMLFGWPAEGVYLVFVSGAIYSYIEDVLVVTFSSLIGVPLLIVLRRIPGSKFPLS